jgi:transposase
MLSRTFGCVRPPAPPRPQAKGPANRAKAKAKVARAHRKVRDARQDFLHKTSTRLVREHDLIVIEDLNAAKNILAVGLAVARGHPGDACGADVRHEGSPPVRSAVKQEPRPVRAGILVLQGGE